MRTPKICEHCQGIGKESLKVRYRAQHFGESQQKAEIFQLKYGKRNCKDCGGTGEDRSVSIDELEDE